MQPWNARLAAFMVAGLFLTGAGRGVGHACGDPPNEANPVAQAEPAPPAPPGAAKGRVADFHTPRDALDAFLTALKARDPVRLREATALRAPIEAAPTNRALFAALLDQGLSEEELKGLASRLEGCEIVDPGSPSRGRCTLTLMKPGRDGARRVLRVSTRREKAGWKVLDISLPPARQDWNVDDLRRHG
jgi:hypothetical protein